MRKILFVITKSNFGGAQRYVFDLANTLPKELYTVTVAFGATGERGAGAGTLERKLRDADIRTIRIDHFMRDVSVWEDVLAFFELVTLIRNERPDVLHVTSSKAGGIGALAGRCAGVPRIIFTSHGLAFDESWRPPHERILMWFFTWLTMLLSHATIQISHDTAERAQRMPLLRRKVRLVHNGVMAPGLLSRNESRLILQQAGGSSIPLESVWIGTLAELHPNKNLDSLIRACKTLFERGVVADLLLVGDGQEKARLRALATELGVADHVHFCGYVANAACLLPALDVFVLPSRKEGLPYVLLEAGLAGCAVVASDINGIKDIVGHDTTGLLVPPGDTDALQNALHKLVIEETLRRSLGDALRLRVSEQFSLQRMVEETVVLYAPSSNPTSSRSSSSRTTGRS